MRLDQVISFKVPRPILNSTETAIREAGEEGYERFVLWSGLLDPDEKTLLIVTVHIPEQKSYKTPDGLLVRVEGPALHHLNAALYESGETLAVQIHAHPQEAYHSRTDSGFPIVTALGGLSIVAPDFATRGVLTTGTAAYRLQRSGWKKIPRRKLDEAILVVDN